MRAVPMFPLNAVVFPGVSMSLHIFEDRYRALMRDLLRIERPADRVFGVVAIREGYEVGEHGMQSAHRVGTLVQLTGHEQYDDGQFDIDVVGRTRLRVDEMHTDGEYFHADVTLLDDSAVDDAGGSPDSPHAVEEAERTLAVFETYRTLLSQLRGGPVLSGVMPQDPVYLSYSLAATCLLTVSQRQGLLEATDATSRLRQLRASLREETRAMRAIPSLPATEVARTRWSPN